MQAWLDNPATNFGWILRASGEENAVFTDKRFDTRECDDTIDTDCVLADRPQLVIGFAPPGIPTTSEWGLIIMAMLIVTASTVIVGRQHSMNK